MARMLRILLVEDSKPDAAIMTRLLKESGLPHILTIVNDGAKVAPALAADPLPDLIILDLNLPHKNGHQVLAEIKGDARLRSIPVIVLTTSTDSQDVIRSYNGFASSYIVKPTTLESARQAVKILSIYWGDVVTLPKEAQWESWE